MKVSLIDNEYINENKGGYLAKVQHEATVDNLIELAEVVMQYPCCVAVTKNGFRKNDDVAYSQFLQFDFDTGEQSSQYVHTQLSDAKINHLIVASKSHNKEKRKISKGMEVIEPAMERFHVYIPLSQPITDRHYYTYLIVRLGERFNWLFDKKCKDIVHYFGKHSAVLFVEERFAPFEANTYLALYDLDKQLNDTTEELSKVAAKNKLTRYIIQKKHYNKPEDLFSDLSIIGAGTVFGKSGYFINCPFHTDRKGDARNTTFAWIHYSPRGNPSLRITCFHNSCKSSLQEYCKSINHKFYNK
jgi:hypothetical protein